ncbi:MAG TPA: hypothetical protein VIJ94_15155 [Caulobacteraceae bacterium]
MTTPAEPLDLSGPFRAALLNSTPISSLLGIYEGEPAVFTSRPVPAAAPYPQAIVSPPISIGNQDMLKSIIPVPRIDISFYGEQPDDYRTVEALGYLARKLFHRQKFSIDLSPDFSVIDIICNGPITAPVDDTNRVGRMVLLQLRLKDLSV